MDVYRSESKSTWLKLLAGAAVLGVIVGAVALVVKLTAKTEFEKAIAEYDDGDYVDSLRILNSLTGKLDFEKAEVVYYYRCKAINRLAEKLEKKFDDELAVIFSPSENKERKERETRYVEERLKKINERVGGDLKIVQSDNAGRIVSGGKFYDEFVAKYKGSAYIEDLDFEELEKLQKSDPARLTGAIFGFYEKYPRTPYLSQLVGILFSNIDKMGPAVSDRGDVLTRFMIDYLRRYPTSSHVHKIFSCKGDGVNLRNSPGVQGKIVGKIAKDELLIQVEKSSDVAQVGDVRDFWYRVMNQKGQQGWIFGKFLSPFDVSRFAPQESEEAWSFEEHFSEWVDSNTPKNWKHLEGAEPPAIGFFDIGSKKIARLDSGGKPSGLYRRTTGARAFTIQSRGRFVSGDEAVLFAYSMGSGGYFSLALSKDGIDVLGRKLPLATNMWHDYTIVSDDGKFARVMVDGELVLNKIPPHKGIEFAHPGLYCLMVKSDAKATIEIEHIKYR